MMEEVPYEKSAQELLEFLSTRGLDKQHECSSCLGCGTREFTGFVTGPTGCGFVNGKKIRCTDCDGKGFMTGWTLKMRRIGKYIHMRRKEMDVSERELATFLNMDFMTLHKLLRGKETVK